MRVYTLDKGKFSVGRNKWMLDMPELEQLKDEFMSYGQPSGYLFSIEFVGGYVHWKALSNYKGPTGQMLRLWREELEAKLAAEAVQSILSISKDPEVSATTKLSANKWILDHIGSEVKLVAPKGRPPISNKQRQENTNEISLADEDYKRLIGSDSNEDSTED